MPESERKFWLNEIEKLCAEKLIDLSKVFSLPYMEKEPRDQVIAGLTTRLGGVELKRERELEHANDIRKQEENYRTNRQLLKKQLRKG